MGKPREQLCEGHADREALTESFYAPESVRRGTVRASRMGRRRAIVLLLVHVAVFAHILHWKLAGETISPVEPSEAMYTVAEGVVNAGAILLLLSIASVLIVGRFFCGWACHLVALQDGCAWLLKKVGIRPRPLRSRLLVWVPLGAALAMFGVPGLVRLVKKLGPPELAAGLTKSEFWETFPGPWLTLLTFGVCGFGMVYLLGAKGFCTYACPYGGIFGLVEKVSPGRIRVTDACKGCGHCTATCTSNVEVADEVARYEMVVDPGCMKCLDCISVCPEEALYFGFGRPALRAKARRKKKEKAPQFTPGEELTMVVVLAVTLTVYTGLPEGFFPWAGSLYGSTPLLLSLGLASTTAFVSLVLLRLARREDVQLQRWRLKEGGRITRTGRWFFGLVALYLVFVVHSGWVQVQTWAGDWHFAKVDVAGLAWRRDRATPLDAGDEAHVDAAERHFERAGALGLFDDFRVPSRLAALAMVRGRPDRAIDLLRRAAEMESGHAHTRSDLASVLDYAGRHEAAIAAAREAERLEPGNPLFRAQLFSLLHRKLQGLLRAGRLEAALPVAREVAERSDPPLRADARSDVALALLQLSRPGEAEAELKSIIRESPDHARSRGMLIELLRSLGRAKEAEDWARRRPR